MKIRHKMSFEAYSDKAVDLMLETAVGKPFRDANGEVIGRIIEVKRTDNPRVLEFVSEINEEEVNAVDSQNSKVVSIDSRRKG